MKKIAVFFIFIFQFINHTQAQKLYAVVVANTYDESIGKSCQVDLIKTTSSFNSIARAIGYEPVIVPVTNDKVTVEGIKTAIDGINCTASDIVAFYFSGHGENNTAGGDFPDMLLLNGKYSLETLHHQLKSKKAKLTISIGDCCNTLIAKADQEKEFRIVKVEQQQEQNFKSLFAEPSGDIIVSASNKAQPAHCNNEVGGFFTHEWIYAINRAVNYAEKPSWQSVMNETKNRVENYRFETGTQTPYFKINITLVPQAVITFDILNKYFSDLMNTDKPRRQLRETYLTYFEKNARVNIYVDTLQTDVLTVENFLDRIYLNYKKIRSINLIETKSKLNKNGDHYQQFTVQELWRKE